MNKLPSIALVFSFFMLSGCSVFGQQAAEKVADAISDYCEKEPYNMRSVYRDSINSELATQGHSISVHCAGDP